MRKLYCRNCGYDLSPMFANGEESGTCPECGATALIERLKLRSWRGSVARRAMVAGLGLTVLGTVAFFAAVHAWSVPRSALPIWLSITPVGTGLAVAYAFSAFRNRVRVSAAGGEFWTFLLGVGVMSAILNAAFQGLITFVGMLFLFSSTRW
jgi:hypothetical protein